MTCPLVENKYMTVKNDQLEWTPFGTKTFNSPSRREMIFQDAMTCTNQSCACDFRDAPTIYEKREP